MGMISPFAQWESILQLPAIEGKRLSAQGEASAFLQQNGLVLSGKALTKTLECFGDRSEELRLAATFLKFHHGEVSAFEHLPLLPDNGQEDYATRRLMLFFEQVWWTLPELACLYLLALFPYPVTRKLLHATLSNIMAGAEQQRWKRASEAQKVFQRLVTGEQTGGSKLNAVLDKLQNDGLLIEREGKVILFRVINEHFAASFKTYFYDEWRIQQQWLAKSYDYDQLGGKQVENKFFAHCKMLLHILAAAQKQQALDQVYLTEISPVLGDKPDADEHMLSLHLYLLQRFFQQPWDKPDFCLEPASKIYLQAQAGQSLHGLNDRQAAQGLLEKVYPELVKAKNWKSAGGVAYALAQHRAAMESPNVADIIELSKQSAAYTELGRDNDSLYTRLRKLISLYKTQGCWREAGLLARKVKKLTRQINHRLPNRPLQQLEQAIVRIRTAAY